MTKERRAIFLFAPWVQIERWLSVAGCTVMPPPSAK